MSVPQARGARRRDDGPGYRVGSAFVRNPFTSPLWRNDAFVRVWSAATISIFGSLITRIALPLVAILTLGAGPIEVALLRGAELVSLMTVGLVAGAWVDRLRRRPVLIWADLGRAVLLGSIPLAFVLGALTFWQLLIVSALAAALTSFFDAADNAYLPTIVERERLVEANSALAASGSAAEFIGVRDQRVPRGDPVGPDHDPHRRRDVCRLGGAAADGPDGGGAPAAARGSRTRA